MIDCKVDTLDKTMNTEIDNFPVSQLQSRFNVGKQTVYNRLDALDIKPFKEKNRSYIKREELQLLDLLHEHISKCGKMADFNKPTNNSPVDTVDCPVDTVDSNKVDKIKSPVDKNNSLVDTVDSKVDRLDSLANPNKSNDLELLVQLLSTSIEKAVISSSQSKSVLSYMKELKEASDEGWLLTTKEVQELIGVKPRTKKGENTYVRGSFSFVKSGKIGGQTSWKVKHNNSL